MQRKAVRKSTIAFIDKEPIHHGEKNELKQITTPKNEWKFAAAALPTTLVQHIFQITNIWCSFVCLYSSFL